MTKLVEIEAPQTVYQYERNVTTFYFFRVLSTIDYKFADGGKVGGL